MLQVLIWNQGTSNEYTKYMFSWRNKKKHFLDPLLIVSQSYHLIQTVDINSYLMANSADPDQMASSEANWSGFTMFVKAG